MVSRTATAVIVKASTVATDGVEATRYYGPFLPHVGSASVHTRNAMGQLVVDNLVSWFGGKGALTPVPECQALAARKKG